MTVLAICLAAAAASGLTLFSGFGLGTLLMPVFALFFPVPTAVALTAVVHLLNNLFKLGLFGQYADWKIVWRFGLPAALSAVVGAQMLILLSDIPAISTYRLLGAQRTLSPVNLVIAALMAGFALIELLPGLKDISFPPRYLPVGGVVSGFFGGLSGHQGAFRSAFLAKCGLSKEQFLGTGILVAIGVDFARISVYAGQIQAIGLGENGFLLAAATGSAFLGAWIGSLLVPKVTMRTIQILVAILLFGIAAGLALGLI